MKSTENVRAHLVEDARQLANDHLARLCADATTAAEWVAVADAFATYAACPVGTASLLGEERLACASSAAWLTSRGAERAAESLLARSVRADLRTWRNNLAAGRAAREGAQ